MRSLRWGPNPICPSKRRKHQGCTHTEERPCEHTGRRQPSQVKEKGLTNPFILDFQPPVLRANKLQLFKTPTLQYAIISISKNIEDLKNSINQCDLTDIYRTPTQQQKITHFFFKCIWNIPQDRPTIFWAIKHTSINLKKLKSYKVYSLTTTKLKLEINNRKMDGKSPKYS